MLTDEAKRLMEEGRIKVKDFENDTKLILKHEPYCGGKFTVQIGKDDVRYEVINEAAYHITEVDDVFNGKLSQRLEKLLINEFHVTVADVEKMTEEELDALYDKACDYEEIKAIEACEIDEDGFSPEAEDAAHIVDWLCTKSGII